MLPQTLLLLIWLELKRYWLNPLRILLSLAQPLMYLFILGPVLLVAPMRWTAVIRLISIRASWPCR